MVWGVKVLEAKTEGLSITLRSHVVEGESRFHKCVHVYHVANRQLIFNFRVFLDSLLLTPGLCLNLHLRSTARLVTVLSHLRCCSDL